MRKLWLPIVILALMISGAVYVHYEKLVLGMGLMLAGLLVAWAWYPWRFARAWFKNRKKGH